MSTILTEAAVYTPSAVVVPAGGDARTAASVNGAFQELTDRSYHALLASSSHLGWSGDFGVEPGGTNSSFTVAIGTMVGAVFVNTGGTAWTSLTAAATTIGASKILGGGNLANSTIFYVYAFDAGAGVVDYEITTVAPSSSRLFKSGAGYAAQSRRYIGFFPTDGAGAPIALRASRGRYVFRMSKHATQTRVLNTSTAVGYTDLSLAGLLPPHVRVAHLRLDLTGGTGAAALFIVAKGDTAGVQARVDAAIGASNGGFCEVETDTSQLVQYSLTLAGTGTANAFVAGCHE